MNVCASLEYAAIRTHYGDRKAIRSGLPYMQHVDEGLAILEMIGADREARLAFCIHPLCQMDGDLAGFDPAWASNPTVLMNAMEYRNVANRYLSIHVGNFGREAKLSPLRQVNQMLVADKIQNRKDYELHQKHSPKLTAYFDEWLDVLGIPENLYRSIVGRL